MAGDASKQDFCAKDCWFYFRRFIIAWGDSVKIRYGQHPKDSPYVWKHMSEYVSKMGEVFDGVRLDNAHSTPKHIAKYMLQKLRTANSNSYVLAEFFTNSRESEAEATRELGINGLIREIQNYSNSTDLSTQCHVYGGCREYIVGKLNDMFIDNATEMFFKKVKQRYPLPVFYDMTHDNKSTLEKYPPGTISLPHLALSNFLCCSIASTYGFDYLLPRNLSVVTESRPYKILQDLDESLWKKDGSFTISLHNKECEYVDIAGSFNDWSPQRMNKDSKGNWSIEITKPGKHEFKFIVDGDWHAESKYPIEPSNGNNIIDCDQSAPLILNDLRYVRQSDSSFGAALSSIHSECNTQNSSIFLHHDAKSQMIQIIRRLHPHPSRPYQCYCIIAHSNYTPSSPVDVTFELPGKLLDAKLVPNSENSPENSVNGVMFSGHLCIDQNKIKDYLDNETEEIEPFDSDLYVYKDFSKFATLIEGDSYDHIKFHHVPEGYVLVVKTLSESELYEKEQYILNYARQLLQIPDFRTLDLATLNYCLYRCNEEELDCTNGSRGVFDIKGAPMIYAGIASLVHIIRFLKDSQDLGHPLFNNLRQGNWLMDYTLTRFEENKKTKFIADNLKPIFDAIKELPNRAKPKYFSEVILCLWDAFIQGQLAKLDKRHKKWISQDQFLIHLFEAVPQFYSAIKSVKFGDFENSLCAGLPHFSTKYMRCWGRDTFIAFKGLLLDSGYHKEARETLIYYARVCRHGLIPNLHDTGHNTRYNARDATWFFLQSIKDYVEHTDEGVAFLDTEIELVFHSDDQVAHLKAIREDKKPRSITIANLIQEILDKHARGIDFTEWNAGLKIDEQMKGEGFHVKIKLDPTTGFIYGGNTHNCGTWMDKMGSSTENKGVPATPRDGAPIELTGLCYSVVSWLKGLYSDGYYDHSGVNIDKDTHYSFETWLETLKYSFER